MKTHLAKTSEAKRQWVEIDASRFTLGRLATRVATLLRGKHKPVFTPHADLGDFVVVTNAKQIRLTGRKLFQKEYIRHTGYPGGIKRERLRELQARRPQQIIYSAVRSMLPTNRLRRIVLRRLKIVPETQHNFRIDKKIS